MVPKKVQDGGGDSFFADEAEEVIKAKEVIGNAAEHHPIDPYEGPSHKTTGVKAEVPREESKGGCPRNDAVTKDQNPHQRPAKKVTHRRHEGLGHLEVPQTKENRSVNTLPPILTDSFFEDEPDCSPVIEDTSNAIRLQRQQQYRHELVQQISQREETRAQRKAKKSLGAAQRHRESAPAPVARSDRSAVEHYENQLRMEQMDEMRRQLAKQREREVQRLRRIYRKDDRKLMAHLHRLKLQDDFDGRGDFEATAMSSAPTQHKRVDLKPTLAEAKPEVPLTKVPGKVASPRVLPKKSDHVQSTLPAKIVEKTVGTKKPVSLKSEYLRLQQDRRAEDLLMEERRAKAEAWKADLARQERLRRDVRNVADWRTGHSLAGVPLAPLSSAQKSRFEAATSWLQRTRAAQHEKRIERDRQLSSWRGEKDRQSRERRMKKKAEESIAREMKIERRKEAEKSFQRWLLEIQARKAAERASVPRGAIGVSTYTGAFAQPPGSSAPKRTKGHKHCRPALLDEKCNESATHKVLS